MRLQTVNFSDVVASCFNLILGFSLNETLALIIDLAFALGFNLILGFSLNETWKQNKDFEVYNELVST